jgi:hypothetical protein
MASMETFPDILEGAFYPDRLKPVKPEAPKPEPEGPKLGRPRKVPAPPRGVFDISLIAEAQRVFNPGLPAAPAKPKGPTATTAALGSSPAMGTGGAWGKPE